MAVDHGHLAENPCRRVRKFRLDNRRERYLTRDEEPRLLKAADGYSRKYLKAIIVIALNTGMRRGEILNLVWADVDATRGLLLVSNTKSGRDRYVPINEAVRNVLGGLSRCEGDEEARLFEIDWIEKGWRRICREAGIRNLRFHDLRHTAATRMSEAGVRETTIAAILGHAGLQMTARYTHATDETVRKAIEMLDSKVPFQICSNETFEQTAKGT